MDAALAELVRRSIPSGDSDVFRYWCGCFEGCMRFGQRGAVAHVCERLSSSGSSCDALFTLPSLVSIVAMALNVAIVPLGLEPASHGPWFDAFCEFCRIRQQRSRERCNTYFWFILDSIRRSEYPLGMRRTASWCLDPDREDELDGGRGRALDEGTAMRVLERVSVLWRKTCAAQLVCVGRDSAHRRA